MYIVENTEKQIIQKSSNIHTYFHSDILYCEFFCLIFFDSLLYMSIFPHNETFLKNRSQIGRLYSANNVSGSVLLKYLFFILVANMKKGKKETGRGAN